MKGNRNGGPGAREARKVRRAVARSWQTSILNAIDRGEADRAYRLTVATVRILRAFRGQV